MCLRLATKRKSGASRTASKKRRKKTSLSVIKFIVILAALYGILFHTPLLNIRNIYVEGNMAADRESIVTASGITVGQNILKINKKAAVANMEKIAYVSSANVKYAFPTSITLVVNEGRIIANVKTPDGAYAAIDSALKVLDVCPQPKVLPVVEGLNVQKSVIGEKLTIDEEGNFDILLSYMNILDKHGISGELAAITISGGEITLQMKNSVVVKCGGTADADYKIAAYKAAIDKQPVSIGTFDVTNPARIVYSID